MSDLSVEEQRSFLAAGIDAVMLRQAHGDPNAPIANRVRILWRGQMPADFPRRRFRPSMESHSW
jgi:hypothetical protein